jgi:hypothetical protein
MIILRNGSFFNWIHARRLFIFLLYSTILMKQIFCCVLLYLEILYSENVFSLSTCCAIRSLHYKSRLTFLSEQQLLLRL